MHYEVLQDPDTLRILPFTWSGVEWSASGLQYFRILTRSGAWLLLRKKYEDWRILTVSGSCLSLLKCITAQIDRHGTDLSKKYDLASYE